MMASRKNLQLAASYVFPSDDSDEEDMSFTGMDFQSMPLEELMQEIAGQQRNINNAEFHNLCVMRNISTRAKKTKSKAVQTGPDCSGIPPSWIITGEQLVDELYTGISNVINCLYHSPFESNKQGATNVHLPPIVGFSDALLSPGNGCTIPRLPSMNPPLFTKLDYQKLIINSAEFKKKLQNLKDTATKLRGLIPYLDASANIEPEKSGKKITKIMKNKYQQTDFEEIPKSEHSGNKSSKGSCTSSTDVLDNLSNASLAASVDSKATNPVEERTLKRHSDEGCSIQKTDSQKGTLKSAGGKKISRSCESIHIPPLTVCRHKLPQNDDESVNMNLVSVGKDRSNRIQGKDEKTVKENPLQNRNVASGSGCKNFIKRNILALKAQSGAASSSKSSSSASHDTQRNLPSQKKREK